MIQDLLRNYDEDPDALWGDPRRNGDLWAAHNPYDLAPRLREVGLFVSVGNGQPGPLDGPATNGQLQQIEQALYPRTSRSWSGCVSSASPSGSTTTAQASTTGPTGSELHRSLPPAWRL